VLDDYVTPESENGEMDEETPPQEATQEKNIYHLHSVLVHSVSLLLFFLYQIYK
jgi:hypothetical protein